MARSADMFKRRSAKGVRIASHRRRRLPAGRNPRSSAGWSSSGCGPPMPSGPERRSLADSSARDRLGALAPGMIAGSRGPGDPIQDIHRTEKVFFVMKEGAVYRNDRPSGQ